ncbi:MAG: histidine phosphatase family protein [Clostridia bacterium]|nr:histidine phosphatase family protein [Clostridia bacterium]
MTKFLFIRHGESEGNLYELFTGQGDRPLTEKGRKQAAATAEYIAAHYRYSSRNHSLADTVYASDLSRAFDTGKAAADRLGLPITPEPGLREILAGEWEGVHFRDLPEKFSEDYALWMHDIGKSRCTGGESVAELGERVYRTVLAIAEANPDRTVLIATHATPIRTLQCRFAGVGLDAMQQIPWVPNASVTEADFEDGVWIPRMIGEAGHLAGIRTELPTDV